MNGSNKKKKRDLQVEQEKALLLNPEKLKKKKKQQRQRALCITALCILGIGLTAFAGFEIVRAIGKSNLKSKAATAVPIMEPIQIEDQVSDEEKKEWQEGWIKHNGQIYAYNEDIMTFLVMGIDKSREVIEVAEGTNGGQADALFMLVLNPHDKTLKVIGINRNTMTDINIYNDTGAYERTVTAQLAVQHGFGNGLEESCQYQVNAVENLFYQLPIHGYCAINMDAIVPLTDLVGGIQLTALEDVGSVEKNADKNTVVIHQGETLTLDGKQAYSYVRYRDINKTGSADERLARQKQYLEQFIQKLKKQTAADITTPVKLYNAIIPQMVTNITADEVTYLVSIARDYHFDSSQIYGLQGETRQGQRFEEYYIDENALYNMILDIFYEEV